MRNRRDMDRTNRTHRVIHLIYEQRLRVGHIAGHMKREVLPTPVTEQMIAGHHSRHDDGRDSWIVTLTYQILTVCKFSNRMTQRIYRCYVLGTEP